MRLERSVRVLLAPLLSDARRKKIADVVANRTGSLAVLLENIWDLGNHNAVMRSMDAFGVHTLHTLTHGRERVKTATEKSEMRTDAGARKWLVRREWTDLRACVHHLKERGYRIASTAPDAEMTLVDIDFTRPLVVAFGNEHVGISDSLLEASDVKFSIPMSGFVQSLNLSVSVAVTLHQAHLQRLAKLVRGTNCLRPLRLAQLI